MASTKVAAAFGNTCIKIENKSISENDNNSDGNGEESSEEDWEEVENVLDDENDFCDLTKDDDSDVEMRDVDDDTKDSEEFDKQKIEKVSNVGDQSTQSDQTSQKHLEHICFSYAPIPPAYPREKIIVVTNLAPTTNRYDIIMAFSKYGTIKHIQKMKYYALVAYSTKEEARQATLANNFIQIRGRTIRARVRDLEKRFRDYPSDQVVFIFDLKPNMPDKTIQNHFSSCGKILAMPYYRCRNGINRIIIFEKPGANKNAFRLNGSYIGTSKIRVKPRGPRAEYYIEGRTVVMFNVNGFTQIAKADLLELFAECGKITDCDILCNIKKLAIITFKSEVGVVNAMKLSGTTVGKIQILLDEYKAAKYRHTKIIVYNLAPGITSSKISDVFKKVAVIDKVHFVKERPFALIEFATTDDYCNAFRLDGEDLCGQSLVLKPFPDRDESLEYILYGNDDWIALWGDRPRAYRGRRIPFYK